LNRIVYPREPESDIVAQILWTTTRIDMNNNNWIPNHFVPVLPVDISQSTYEENISVKLAYRESLTSTRISHTISSNIIEDNDDNKVENYIGSYVLVEYQGHAYPGYVENIDSESQMLYVECMHRVGSKNANCFFWPKKIRDENWYELDDILGVIRKPELIDRTTSHFQVDDNTWKEVMQKLEK